MIENLSGIHESVQYEENTNLRIYDNTQAEYYPQHWHTQLEIVMPVKGSYNIICDNAKYVLNPFDIMFICPGTIHSMGSYEEGERIIIQAEYNLLMNFKSMASIITLLSPVTAITPDTASNIHNELKLLVLKIRETYISKNSFMDITIYSLLLEILSIIGNNYTASSVVTTDTGCSKYKAMADTIVKSCEYINEHFNDDINLDTLAKLTGFSKYYFERQFKLYTGVSFYKYLSQKRILEASQMLISSGYSITEISYRCGFSNVSTFIRMFKSVNGYSPKEFRRMYISSRDNVLNK